MSDNRGFCCSNDDMFCRRWANVGPTPIFQCHVFYFSLFLDHLCHMAISANISSALLIHGFKSHPTLYTSTAHPKFVDYCTSQHFTLLYINRILSTVQPQHYTTGFIFEVKLVESKWLVCLIFIANEVIKSN